MDLVNNFSVNVPIADAWKILMDVERIAPCLPGAELQEVEGDIYRGVVKVKVGPIQAAFKGQASFLSQDESTYTAVLKGEGRDTGGKGNASANITLKLESGGDSVTNASVVTDLSITGKVAQFGRGAMADISNKLMAQFVDNLNQLISSSPAPAAAPVSETSTPAPAASVEPTGVRKIEGPAAKPIDLLDAAGAPILKRAIPVVVVIAAVVIWLIVK